MNVSGEETFKDTVIQIHKSEMEYSIFEVIASVKDLF